ncbi:hypothetical protein ACR3I8_17650 [Priestia flexa]|uniref:hypothetical protein n=1 Tax=Priestia flexa TaxID=86664 RepID=UPI001B33A7FC|nr:hypothetical protein [Priestia flexa]MDT2047767.1 hypothetical protein [Priestia flexa]
MKNFDTLPKNVKKTIRYINQDASIEQLEEIKRLVLRSIKKKEKELHRNVN